MEYRFKDGVRVYNDGISKEGYLSFIFKEYLKKD